MGEVEPTYPFGHGHSYAEFAYTDAEFDNGTLSVTIKNKSNRDGREVIQAYIRPPETDAKRPVRELAGFAAIDVPAGCNETVEIDLDKRTFSRYDESAGWTVDSGTYTIEVGRSSGDTRIEVKTDR